MLLLLRSFLLDIFSLILLLLDFQRQDQTLFFLVRFRLAIAIILNRLLFLWILGLLRFLLYGLLRHPLQVNDFFFCLKSIVIRSLLIDHYPQAFFRLLLFAVLTVPNLYLVDLIHAEIGDILGALRMNPTSVDTFILAHFTSDHEVWLDAAFAHAIKASVQETTIPQRNDRRVKHIVMCRQIIHSIQWISGSLFYQWLMTDAKHLSWLMIHFLNFGTWMVQAKDWKAI